MAKPDSIIEAAVIRQVLNEKFPRLAMGNIAFRYKLTMEELKTVLDEAGYPDPGQMRRRLEGLETKTCTRCGEIKPLSEFYSSTQTRDRRSSHCRVCSNKRPPTERRMLRTRARNRAYALLIKHHQAEFDQLIEQEYIKAIEEHERLVAEAQARGQSDAKMARLKPGPKRKGQVDARERLDVARCPKCHAHHDMNHLCPNCGEETPEQREEGAAS